MTSTGSIRISPPAADEYGEWYAGYVARVSDDAFATLAALAVTTPRTLAAVPEERAGYRYAPGKWSTREVVLHLADAERIFAYRALRIARGDTTPLPGFDENAYTPESRADSRTLADIVAELVAVRRATLALFAGLPPETLTRRGTASGTPISVRALAYVIAGHEMHHLAVLRERYGVEPAELPTPDGVGQVAIRVTDLGRALGFYRDTLGLPVLLEVPGRLAFLACGGTRLMLSTAEGDGGAGAASVIYYRVPDVRAAHAAFEARGVAFAGPPHSVGRLGGRDNLMAFTRDPDGNLLAIMSEVPIG